MDTAEFYKRVDDYNSNGLMKGVRPSGGHRYTGIPSDVRELLTKHAHHSPENCAVKQRMVNTWKAELKRERNRLQRDFDKAEAGKIPFEELERRLQSQSQKLYQQYEEYKSLGVDADKVLKEALKYDLRLKNTAAWQQYVNREVGKLNDNASLSYKQAITILVGAALITGGALYVLTKLAKDDDGDGHHHHAGGLEEVIELGNVSAKTRGGMPDVIRLTNSKEAEKDPQLSPDGEKVVYAANDNPDFAYTNGIKVIDRNGQLITLLGENKHFPHFDPSGKYVVAGNQIARIDTGEIITINSSGMSLLNSIWSPDGSKIASVGSPKDIYTSNTIYISKPDGSEFKEIINFIDGEISFRGDSLRWHPDSNNLLFIKDWHLYFIKADGSDLKDLSNIGQVYQAEWGSDGNTIFLVRGTSSNFEYIYSVNPDGSDIKQITKDSYPGKTSFGGLEIAKDNRIVFNAQDGCIYSIYPSGKNLLRLAKTNELCGFLGIACHPQSDKVVFSQEVEKDWFDLYITSIDNGELIKPPKELTLKDKFTEALSSYGKYIGIGAAAIITTALGAKYGIPYVRNKREKRKAKQEQELREKAIKLSREELEDQELKYLREKAARLKAQAERQEAPKYKPMQKPKQEVPTPKVEVEPELEEIVDNKFDW